MVSQISITLNNHHLEHKPEHNSHKHLLFSISCAAGKTTILYRLQNESDEAVQTIPTIGFNVETLQYKNIKVSDGNKMGSVDKRARRINDFARSNSSRWRGNITTKSSTGRKFAHEPAPLSFLSFSTLSSFVSFSFKCGTWEDRQVFDHIGDVTIQIPMPLFLWWTRPTLNECPWRVENWRPCWKRMI